MGIILGYAPNTCALAPYITLTEAGAELEIRPLDFRRQQNKSADYLKLNPKHKVPLPVIDGTTLTESAAHFERIKARPSARKLRAFEKEVLDAFAKAA